MKGFLPDQDRLHVLENLEFSKDPTSSFFAERFKAIRYVTVKGDKVETFEQDYFIQHAGYNDFSGGFKRHFNLIPEELFQSVLADVVLKFSRYYCIPDGTILFVQIQTSLLEENSRRQSITGQGIHTDGHDRAMLLCMHRGSHVRGALNQFHQQLDGSEPLCDPVLLEAGDAVMFKDNEIYHYVTPGKGISALDAGDSDTRRTMLLIHSPAECNLDGGMSQTNSLRTSKKRITLRDSKLDALGNWTPTSAPTSAGGSSEGGDEETEEDVDEKKFDDPMVLPSEGPAEAFQAEELVAAPTEVPIETPRRNPVSPRRIPVGTIPVVDDGHS